MTYLPEHLWPRWYSRRRQRRLIRHHNADLYRSVSGWHTRLCRNRGLGHRLWGKRIDDMAAAIFGDPYGYVVSANPVALGALGSPAGLGGIGLTSFSLVVPEPGTVVLGVIGVSVFLVRLRRKP